MGLSLDHGVHRLLRPPLHPSLPHYKSQIGPFHMHHFISAESTVRFISSTELIPLSFFFRFTSARTSDHHFLSTHHCDHPSPLHLPSTTVTWSSTLTSFYCGTVHAIAVHAKTRCPSVNPSVRLPHTSILSKQLLKSPHNQRSSVGREWFSDAKDIDKNSMDHSQLGCQIHEGLKNWRFCYQYRYKQNNLLVYGSQEAGLTMTYNDLVGKFDKQKQINEFLNLLLFANMRGCLPANRSQSMTDWSRSSGNSLWRWCSKLWTICSKSILVCCRRRVLRLSLSSTRRFSLYLPLPIMFWHEMKWKARHWTASGAYTTVQMWDWSAKLGMHIPWQV